MRVKLPRPKALPPPQTMLMPQAAAIAPTSTPAVPRIGDFFNSGLICASTNPLATTMKQSAVTRDIRPPISLIPM